MKPTQLILGMMMMFAWAAYADDTTNAKPPEMTAAQKACFTDNGMPAPGEGAPPKERPSKEVGKKIHECLKKNGMTHPPGHMPERHGMHDGHPPKPQGDEGGDE